MTESSDSALLQLTADIVAAHVSNNNVPVGEVPALIARVHDALAGLGSPAEQEPAELTPAVPIRSSVKPDYIVCLEDGKKLKMLRRYLRTNFNMSPEEYRAKWKLPANYPMVAPNYAEQRRGLAHAIGLGRKKAPEAAAPAAAAEPEAPAAAAKPRRRVAKKAS
jgi:predicted transcriptional regulator